MGFDRAALSGVFIYVLGGELHVLTDVVAEIQAHVTARRLDADTLGRLGSEARRQTVHALEAGTGRRALATN